MYKTSKYVVFSEDRFVSDTGQQWRLAYATRTASLLPVADDVVQALLDGREAAVSPEDEQRLLDAGVLCAEQEDERAQVILAQRQASARANRRKITLLPSSYCNMGCSYCGQSHVKGRLTPEHRAAVQNRVLRAIASDGTDSLQINWFGAEPLMGYAVICDLSKSFVAAADEAGVEYAAQIITNGSLLTARKLETLHVECRVAHVEITLDGPAAVHDKHRPLKSGGSSFARIVAVLQEAVRNPQLAGLVIGLRTNVDVHNRAYVSEYLRLMAESGLGSDRVFFSFHPVHAWGNDLSSTQVGMTEYARLEAGWLSEAEALGLSTPLIPTSVKGAVCTAVTRASEVISPSAKVFACTEHPLVPGSDPEEVIADALDLSLPTLRPSGPFDDWHDSLEASGTPCGQCVFLPVCGGSCPKLWRSGECPCPSYKFNMQDRMRLVAEQNGMSVLDIRPMPLPVAQ